MVWRGDKYMINQFIYITDTMEFIHQYKDAPEEVAYLRNLHRHLLHIKVAIEVFSDDREIEFIMFKHAVHNYLYDECYGSNCSCETISKMLLCFIQNHYGNGRDINIQISEDGETGCELIYRKEN